MKNINKNIIALGWVSFFTDMASAMLVPIIPIFVVSVLQSGADKLGVILAVSSFISYFLRFFTGYIAEKNKLVKPLMVIGYVISAVCKPLFFWSYTWQSVAALRGTERIGKSIRTAPKDLMISHYSEVKKSGQSFGFHKMMDISGELTGILVVFILFYFYSSSEALIRQIFIYTAIPGLIAVFIMAFFVQDITYHKKEKAEFKFARQDRKLLVPMMFFFLFTFFIFEESFFILRSKELSFSLTLIPLLVLVSKLTQTLVSYKIGLLVDQHDHKKMMAVAYLSGVISLSLFISGESWLIWIGFAVYGFYCVSSLNILRALISEQASQTGGMFGVFYAGMAVSLALSALVFGHFWEAYGGQTALTVSLAGSSVLLAIYLIYLFFVNKLHKMK